MTNAPDTLVGKSIEWTGVHHSEHGDFTDISTHVVTYETRDACYVAAGGKLVAEARYTYKKLDDRMAIVIYHPKEISGAIRCRSLCDVRLAQGKDRAVLLAGGEPFAVADGSMREVATPPRP